MVWDSNQVSLHCEARHLPWSHSDMVLLGVVLSKVLLLFT